MYNTYFNYFYKIENDKYDIMISYAHFNIYFNITL